MASTRNKNTPSDYRLQQKSYKLSREWIDYNHSSYGQAYDNAMPAFGITPSHMPRSILSSNSIDIETKLFGINSTNLVSPDTPVNPALNNLPEISFFNTLPMIMPEKMVVSNIQRPFPIPK